MVKKILGLFMQQAFVVEEKIRQSTKLATSDLLREVGNTLNGYTSNEVETQRERFGENVLIHKKEASIAQLIFESIKNPFSLVLLTLAVISFFTKDYAAVTIIVLMVTLSSILGITQELKSTKAVEQLTEMVETTVTVQRKEDLEVSSRQEIPMDELVVGDILYLSAGDIIPADVRLIQTKDFFVTQSSLTGESEPIEKYGDALNEEVKQILEANNLVFMGSNVVSGSATGIVLAVGNETMFGNIAKSLQEKSTVTNFEKGINSVSMVFVRFMLIMAPIVFVMNGITKGNWLEAFLFAISIAVGLTPEMLPMIVSVNLAKGAMEMSKKKVIVKKLNAIQNFGAMDILCTDKTGTITQDKVTLKYYLNIHGDADDRILRHGFLNSYYQTGLKNLMDLAIISHVDELEQKDLFNNYRKIDEIPFDFNRRRMSVVVENINTEKYQLITKGAIEEMISICSHAEYNEVVEELNDNLKQEILNRCYEYNEKGFRVLGIAHKKLDFTSPLISVEDEREMVLLGFLAFFDPPKESTKDALQILNEYGVRVKVLTGDNDAVTKYICNEVGLNVQNFMLGEQVEALNDEELQLVVEDVDVFAKLSPAQKTRIVQQLHKNGHTVGFMGDGINDASAMKVADVGISVDSAVDIAKESASIILLEKDLMVLEKGVVEGRKTFTNILKYIKITASSNFGNMFSVLAASVFLPFLPMMPLQILILNLIYDISCTAIPWDNVDEEYLKEPRQWDAKGISKFMVYFGPTSSIFDIITYLILFFGICPLVFGGSYGSLSPEMKILFISMFQTGWFIESLWTQTFVIHMLRTQKIPFIQSRASLKLIGGTLFGIVVGTLIPMTFVGKILDMTSVPALFFAILIVIIIFYNILTSCVKYFYIKKYSRLL
ncbi:magnesium-translocating P-type ATPase [Anaerorhabdus furcosa]|uniref:Magnesium-transporting ATPase, P-type 1 n=1 Tax=Anaerorhabdus furcosa TaxID=118967 RepID=A0A1T4NWS7_9FIRM|nr:magnesium-translocating P-type ATPase [Anaerorhabdus furcosa]SJZ83492.1 Mg2+-importing ATPase [Anaerorhabdus furcosa]